jgi:hypothetical protein
MYNLVLSRDVVVHVSCTTGLVFLRSTVVTLSFLGGPYILTVDTTSYNIFYLDLETVELFPTLEILKR